MGDFTFRFVYISLFVANVSFGIILFSICVLDDPNAPESGEDCFKPVTLGDGSPKYVLPNKEEEDNVTVNLTLKLPDGLTCERCVLRWHYNAGK
jgi:hypothetical protein